MDALYTWTVDVETDWGGRTNGREGIKHGLPRILDCFKRFEIYGLFFISTEIIKEDSSIIKEIKDNGHEVGSHGHFHTVFKEAFRQEADKDLSLSYIGKGAHYRAPKFCHITEDIYSNPKGHVGLLKYMWFKTKIPPNPIFYLHPFDIVGGSDPPNLFCRLWYSRPEGAFHLFENLLERYS